MSALHRLKAIAWGSAQEWDPSARELVYDYYVRILPHWPEGAVRILPDDAHVASTLEQRLTEEERAQVDTGVAEVLAAADARRHGLARTTKALCRLILTTSALVTRGQLTSDEDLAEPLLRVFEAGFEIMPTHAGLDLVHAVGMTTIPIPTRSAIEARAARRHGPGSLAPE